MTISKAHVRAILPSLLAVTIMATAASASEGGRGGEGEGGSAWITLGLSFVNFTIFVLLLRKYAWPAVQDFLVNRRKEVADAMAAAEEARRESERIRQEFAAKEAALEETRRRLLEEIRTGAAADREKLLKEAQDAAARLKAEAERQAENDMVRARRELRAEAARLAAELAEKEVRARLSDADRERLVREFVDGAARQ